MSDIKGCEMNIEMFKKDLMVREFIGLVVSNETGYEYKFNKHQINEIKDLTSLLFYVKGCNVLYLYNKEILHYTEKNGKLIYISSTDISKNFENTKFKDIKISDIDISIYMGDEYDIVKFIPNDENT